jgi:formate hydrogenlyase subunit 3/multisubunit Na+/H+ antiporter MnhD subunit
MSGAMVKLGVYGLLRVGWDLLGGGPRWWWALVLAVGGVSALFGVLHALVATDLKRLLAYSTSENVGLVLVGIGAAGLFAASGSEALSGAALVAALLHCLNHAAFKALLFLAAGNVVHSTGTRDLDRLGGLVRRMPFTAAGFAVGALAIAGLPPFNGFVSEWLLLQALVHGLGSSSDAVRVVMPVAVAVVALTGGLAVATFVTAFGTGFLALPRSAEAAAAREGARPTQAAIALLAGACAVTGLFPALALGPLNRAVGDLGAAGGAEALRNGVLEIRSVGIPSTMAPAIVALVLVLAAVPVLWTRRRTAGRAVVGAPVWGCGRTVHTPRMEYTATAFAEPLLRVFDDVLHPDRDVDVSHSAESRYYVEAVRFRQGVRDAVDERAYAPLLRTARRWGLAARHIQNGSIHRYLAYMFVAVVVVLVVAR